LAHPASLEGIATDSADTFEGLIQRRLDRAYRLASLILLDASDAEDATHDAIVKAARAWPALRDRSLADAWFDRIVVNVCRDRLRRRRSHQVIDLSVEVTDSLAIADVAGDAIERDRMRRALRRLSPEQRCAVVLRYYEDLTVDEIARRTDIPAGTVKSRLHQALRELRAALAADEREAVR
jgi:RNA polymerase sigma-70 factor (ECF subfamily)